MRAAHPTATAHPASASGRVRWYVPGPPLPAPDPIKQIEHSHAALGVALVERSAAESALLDVVAGINHMHGTSISASGMRARAIDEGRGERRASHSGGVTPAPSGPIVPFAQWHAKTGYTLPSVTVAALGAAYERYSEAVETQYAARDAVITLGREHANPEIARSVGERHLAVVKEYIAGMGVPLEVRGKEIKVSSWYDAGHEGAYHVSQGDRIHFGRTGDRIPYAFSLDMVAHEYGHRVMRQLVPGFQRGSSPEALAIDEYFSDLVAALVDPEGDWQIAEDISPNGYRNMDTDAKRVSEIARTGNQKRLGYTLSSVPSGASWKVGTALGRDVLGELMFAAVPRLDTSPKLIDLGRAVAATSVELYGPDSHRTTVILDAWSEALDTTAEDLLNPPIARAPSLGRAAAPPPPRAPSLAP